MPRCVSRAQRSTADPDRHTLGVLGGPASAVHRVRDTGNFRLNCREPAKRAYQWMAAGAAFAAMGSTRKRVQPPGSAAVVVDLSCRRYFSISPTTIRFGGSTSSTLFSNLTYLNPRTAGMASVKLFGSS